MVVGSRGGRKTLIILHSTLLLPARGDAASWQRPWSAGLSTRVLTGRSTRGFFGGVCVFFFFPFFFLVFPSCSVAQLSSSPDACQAPEHLVMTQRSLAPVAPPTGSHLNPASFDWSRLIFPLPTSTCPLSCPLSHSHRFFYASAPVIDPGLPMQPPATCCVSCTPHGLITTSAPNHGRHWNTLHVLFTCPLLLMNT